jgi:methyl-accepting chemotaxis protein
MSVLNSLTIRKKLILSFLILSAVTAAVGFVGIRNMSKINDMADQMYLNELLGLSYIKEANIDLMYMARAEKNLLLAATAADREKFLGQHRDAEKLFVENLAKARPLFHSERGKAALAKLDRAWQEYEPVGRKIVDTAVREDLQRSRASVALSIGEGREKITVVDDTLTELSRIKEGNAKDFSELTTALYGQSRAFLLVLMVGAALFGIGVGIILSKNIGNILNSLLDETGRLTQAATEGKLDTRGDTGKINFEFRGIVEGVNRMLDAVINPLNVAAEYIDRIGKGDIPPKITDNYSGDFNEIKMNLNNCIDNVEALVADAETLSEAALEGRLDTRAKADRHQGDFRKIVAGVNGTLDAVIGPLNVAAEYVDRISKGDIPPRITDNYKGDFNEIKNNLNVLIESMNKITILARDISEGNLMVEVRERSAQDELMRALSVMVAKLTDVVTDVKDASESVASGSAELSASAEQMSQGATEQASSAEEASSSMEEMSANIKQTAENAQLT